MSKLITVTSGKGGVGKTTTAINLAVALNGFGKEVIIVDANLSTPNVGLHLGAPIVPVSLNHVLQGKASIADAMYEHETGTKIIPSSLSINELKKLNHARLKDVGKRLRRMSEIVIYDSAAGLGEEAIAAIESADELILVTNPEIPAVTDALKASKLIEQMGRPIRGVIVTRVKNSKYEMPIANIHEMLELPIIGIVPEDIKVKQSLVEKSAVVDAYPKSKASLAYKKIAARLIGNNNYQESYSFLERIFSR